MAAATVAVILIEWRARIAYTMQSPIGLSRLCSGNRPLCYSMGDGGECSEGEVWRACGVREAPRRTKAGPSMEARRRRTQCGGTDLPRLWIVIRLRPKDAR